MASRITYLYQVGGRWVCFIFCCSFLWNWKSSSSTTISFEKEFPFLPTAVSACPGTKAPHINLLCQGTGWENMTLSAWTQMPTRFFLTPVTLGSCVFQWSWQKKLLWPLCVCICMNCMLSAIDLHPLLWDASSHKYQLFGGAAHASGPLSHSTPGQGGNMGILAHVGVPFEGPVWHSVSI